MNRLLILEYNSDNDNNMQHFFEGSVYFIVQYKTSPIYVWYAIEFHDTDGNSRSGVGYGEIIRVKFVPCCFDV